MRTLFWPDPDADAGSCVVIQPGQKSVDVEIVVEGKRTPETLNVQLTGDFIDFQRADGSKIAPPIYRHDVGVDMRGPFEG